MKHVAPMQIKPPKREDDDIDAWLWTYADTITLLMAFFVILFALSTPTPQKFKEFAEQLRLEGFTKVERVSESKKLKEKLQLMLEDSGFDQYASITETDKTIELELASSAFYETGSARFTKKGLPLLERVATQLKQFEATASSIEIEGHTDDSPIATDQFPSNWELSGARASNVVRFLIAHGLAANKLRAVGFSDTRPKAENRDATGNPIPANQDLNRRVVVKIVKKDY